MTAMKLNILNVQRFCTKDGPGIRTTVFLKGCPLSCLWCHNPESQSARKELMYNPEKCVHCLRCVSLCPTSSHTQTNGTHHFARASCLSCGACLSPTCEALELAGKSLSVDEILEEVLKDSLYYQNSGGGLTLSGGEPLAQWEGARELLQKAKAHGIHTAVETCGQVSRKALEETLPYTDLYLFDWKESDPERHARYTGVDNRHIRENLAYIDSMKKEIILRCPIIPTLNDREEHLVGIAQLARELAHVSRIVIEPYHTLGVGKYERLGKRYSIPDIPTLDREAANSFAERLRKKTQTPVELA